MKINTQENVHINTFKFSMKAKWKQDILMFMYR